MPIGISRLSFLPQTYELKKIYLLSSDQHSLPNLPTFVSTSQRALKKHNYLVKRTSVIVLPRFPVLFCLTGKPFHYGSYTNYTFQLTSL